MNKVLLFMVIIISFICISCQKFSFIETKNGQSVFLDSNNGKVVYVNNSNRVSDYVDLKINEQEIAKIKNDKEINDSAQKMKDWGKNSIPGTKYSLEFLTRFYNDKLLYILQIEPYDDNTARIANTITVDLIDTAGFTLETIEPPRWTRVVDEKGKTQMLNSGGNIPITLENYMEIFDWSPSWRN